MDSLETVAAAARLLMARLSVEVVAIVPVRAGRPGAPILISTGEADRASITPARVFQPLIASRADEGILVHNHLRDVSASACDRAVTRRLVAAGVLLGIPLSGHLVVGPRTWSDCLTGAQGPTPWPRSLTDAEKP